MKEEIKGRDLRLEHREAVEEKKKRKGVTEN